MGRYMPSLRNSSRIAALCVIILGCIEPLNACFYSKFKFNSTELKQTTLEGILYDRYPDLERDAGSVARIELEKIRPEIPKHLDDLNFLDDYAYLLQRTGQLLPAESVYQHMLELQPNRFETLCSIATVQQQLGHFDKAHDTLTKVAGMKPDFRGDAEQWHLRMVDFLLKQRQDPSYVRTHLFIDELTPIWLKHYKDKTPAFGNVELPIRPKQGVIELLRQFPNFGDGWLVLGILLENSGDLENAKLAYRRADRFGTSMSRELQDYLPRYETYSKGTGRILTAGWGLLKLLIIIIGGFILLRVFRFVQSVWSDRKEAKKRAEAEEDERLKKHGKFL
jgi:tetratricopeptide (TPR) repeat protein